MPSISLDYKPDQPFTLSEASVVARHGKEEAHSINPDLTDEQIDAAELYSATHRSCQTRSSDPTAASTMAW